MKPISIMRVDQSQKFLHSDLLVFHFLRFLWYYFDFSHFHNFTFSHFLLFLCCPKQRCQNVKNRNRSVGFVGNEEMKTKVDIVGKEISMATF